MLIHVIPRQTLVVCTFFIIFFSFSYLVIRTEGAIALSLVLTVLVYEVSSCCLRHKQCLLGNKYQRKPSQIFVNFTNGLLVRRIQFVHDRCKNDLIPLILGGTLQ